VPLVSHAPDAFWRASFSTAAQQRRGGDADQTKGGWFGHGGAGDLGGWTGNQRVAGRRQDAALSVEGIVDQGVVTAVNDTVIVEVAVVPASQMVDETVVDQRIVAAVDFAIQIGVAEVGVFDQYVGRAGIGPVERTGGR